MTPFVYNPKANLDIRSIAIAMMTEKVGGRPRKRTPLSPEDEKDLRQSWDFKKRPAITSLFALEVSRILNVSPCTVYEWYTHRPKVRDEFPSEEKPRLHYEERPLYLRVQTIPPPKKAPRTEAQLKQLAEARVRRAEERALRREAKNPTRNLTSDWLAKNWSEIRTSLQGSLARRIPLSSRMGLIDDHLQTFLCRLIERDSLRPYLLERKKISVPVLSVWAYQSAFTEMRGWGVDASCRASRGAKTNRDRLVGAPPNIIQSPRAVKEIREEDPNEQWSRDESFSYSSNPKSAYSRRSRIVEREMRARWELLPEKKTSPEVQTDFFDPFAPSVEDVVIALEEVREQGS